MKDFVGKLLARVGRRTVAITLALLVAVGTLPIVWPSASGNEPACGLEEHTHSEECFEFVCTQPEGDIFGSHAHTEGCFAQKLVCGCEEGAEHTSECYESEKICAVEEGEEVLLSSHAHAEGCYAAVCGKAEHTHSAECEAAEEEALPECVEDEEISLLAGSTELSVGGVWDVGDSSNGHENIPFGSDDTATIEHGDDYQSEEVSVRVTATYPAGASDLKLKVELAEGLDWVSNGESSINASALASVSSQQGRSKIYGRYLNNGYYTYTFNEGVESVSITIRVMKPSSTNFGVITDAIKVTASCTENGESRSVSSSLSKLQCEQFAYISYNRGELEKTVKANEIAFNYGFVLHNYDSTHFISHHRLYDFVEVTVTAPKGAVLASTDVSHSGSGGISDIVVGGWKLVSTDDSASDVTKYTVRTEHIYNQAIGSTFEWIFPESFVGQKVLVEYSGITWKLYGDDTVNTLPADKTRKTYYNIVSPNATNEIVEGKNIEATLAYDASSPDGVYKMGGFVIQNSGTDDSVPKIVEYNFDDTNIGVTNVSICIPAVSNATVRIWFKVHGDDTWYEKTVTKKMTSNATITQLGRLDITNLDLGLSADTYLSALKYECDYLVDDNGTPDDTSDDIRTGFPAGRKTTGYGREETCNGGHNPFAGVNLRLSDTNPVAISTVTVRDKYDNGLHEPLTYTVTTTYSGKPENFIYLIGNESLEKKAGESFTVTMKLSAYWASQSEKAYTTGFTQYPIIYIRDETGEGISNIKLVNTGGEDIIAKYPNNIAVTLDHTETVDYNGDGKFAKVYKIDTTGLSVLPSRSDRYAAAVGYSDTTAVRHTLNLSYTIYTPSTYNDGNIVHRLSEAVFLSDPQMAKRTNKAYGTKSDPYDVDGDGVTTGEKDIIQSQNQSNTLCSEYSISPSADISIAAAAKKTEGGSYTTWDGSDSYVQIQSGEEYDVCYGIYNGAGVTTSTEDGKKTIIYIPVPKKGDQWGAANSGVDKDGNALTTFAYDMTLSGAVDNPDPDVFTVSYGTVDTSGFGAGDAYGVIGQKLNSSTAWSSSYSDSTNCVRIIVSGMDASESIADAMNIILPLVADENANNREVNIFSAIFYEDITNISGDNYKMWKGSDRLALQIAIGEISGKVWIDLDGDGIQDEGEKGMAGVTVFAVDEDSESKQTTTDANGEYSFEKLPIGKYFLSFQHSDMKKYACSPMNVGSNTAIDNDGRIHTATLDGLLTGVQITFAYIPFTDGMGNTSYHAEHMDVGLAPLVEVEYQWSGKIPAAAALPSGKTIASGTKYNAAAVASVDGYTFDGWYTDSALTSSFANGTAVIKDTVLYGKWSINEYDITYSFVGEAPAGAAAPAADTAEHGTSYTAKDAAAVEGWLFDGWYTDSGCTTKFTSAEVTADIDLYGRWIDNTITVSGTKTWEDVPAELAVPAITIDLMLDGEAVDSVTLASGETNYTFTDAAKYAAVGEPALEYTVQEREVANYIAAYSDPVTDAEGNITIDITNTGDFTYSSLVISNTVAGEDAPADAEFVYTVTLDSALEYPYTGSASGMIKSGDKITLKAGESITISGLLVGVAFSVEQNEVENFVTTPAGRKIEGAIASTVSLADFTNNFKLPPVGNLTITNKITGNKADTTLKFPFKVEFDADGSYELRIYAAGETIPSSGTGMLGGASIVSAAGARAVTGTIKSGDTIELGHGETAIIYGLPAEISYKVTETDTKGYKMTSTGAAGSIAEDGSTASFINDKSESSGGSANVPDTGDSSGTAIAAAIMSLAAMSMLLCGIAMRKSKEENC